MVDTRSHRSRRGRSTFTRFGRAAAALTLGVGALAGTVASAPAASAAPANVTLQWPSTVTIALDPTCTFVNSLSGAQISLAPAPGNQVWVTLDQCDDGNSRAMLVDGTNGATVSPWETTPRYEQAGSGAAVNGTGQLTRPYDAVADSDPLATTTQSRTAAASWVAGPDCPATTTPASLFDGGGNLGVYCIAQNDGDPDYVRTVGASNADISLGVISGLSGRMPTGLRSDGNPTALGVAYPDITTVQQWNGASWATTSLTQPIPQIPAYPAGSDATGRAIAFGSTVNVGGFPVYEVNTNGQVNSGTLTGLPNFFANAAVDDGGALYAATTDGTNMALGKYTVAAAPVTGDTVTFNVVGGVTYANSAALTAGNLSIVRDANGIKTVAGTGTIPSSVSGNATVAFNVNRFWILNLYLGTVALNDPAANVSLGHLVFFSSITPVGLTGATNTQGWAVFSTWPWKTYTMTWTVQDLA